MRWLCVLSGFKKPGFFLQNLKFSILMMANRVDRSSPYFFYDLLDQLQQKDLPFCMAQTKRIQTRAGLEYLEHKIAFIQAFVDQLEQELEGVERSDPFL